MTDIWLKICKKIIIWSILIQDRICYGTQKLNSDHVVTRLLATEYSQSGFTFIELKRNGGEICITGATDLSEECKIPSKFHGLPVTEIGECAFENCSSLESIELPESLTEIGASAFENCSSLESIELPESLIEIGASAFEDSMPFTVVPVLMV